MSASWWQMISTVPAHLGVLAGLLLLGILAWLSVSFPALGAPGSGSLLSAVASSPASSSRSSNRQVRQRRSILAAFARGERDRATLLAHEHLAEFPDDEVVREALASN